jgi:hypothetical protein
VNSRTAQPAWLLGLGLLGAVATAIALWTSVGAPSGLPLVIDVRVPPAARALLLGCLASLILALVLASPQTSRRHLLVVGLAGLGGLAALVVVPDPLAAGAVVILLGAGHASLSGRRSFAVRMRGPALAALLLGIGWSFVRVGGSVGRVGALCLALAVVAAAGLMPYLADFDREEPATSSSLVWTAFLAPVMALSLLPRILPAMSAEEGTTLAATLVALGLLNLVWGAVGAWRTSDDAAAWRCSFLADWGLALTGMGVLLRDGREAAYLALLAMVVVRLPLYLQARPSLLQSPARRIGPTTVLTALILAGMAPFSGFPVRLLLLRATTQLWWPLALVLLALVLLAAPGAFRLARTLEPGHGKEAIGFYVVVAISVALGLAPGAFLALAGY